MTLGIYPKELKAETWTDIRTHMFVAFIIAKRWKQSKCPSTNEWIHKMFIHTIEYYPALKRNSDTCYHIDDP